jgi:hypothetical protein
MTGVYIGEFFPVTSRGILQPCFPQNVIHSQGIQNLRPLGLNAFSLVLIEIGGNLLPKWMHIIVQGYLSVYS